MVNETLMTLKTPLLFLTLILFTSCNDKTVFSDDTSDFTANQWMKNDVKTFTFSNETTQNFNLSVNISHVYDYQFDKIPLGVGITNPEGATDVVFFDLILKDNQGKDLGDCLGDICDLQQIFKKNYTLGKGKYTFTVFHKFEHPYVPNISNLGITVEKSE
jgi:gliding motility-associated lipoprotein GldH